MMNTYRKFLLASGIHDFSLITTYFVNPFPTQRDKRFIITLFSLCFIYVMPIVMADRYYIDDLGRSQFGYDSWSSNGRPLADVLMILLGFWGRNIVDISPLTLILSVLIYVFSAYCYFKSNFSDTSPVFSAVIFFFAFANPFLLENLSYKFDSLSMLAALSVQMFAFLNIGSKPISWLISILVITASLCLYQASIGFFVCLSIMEYIQEYTKPTSYPVKVANIYMPIITRIVQLLSAYVIYIVGVLPVCLSGNYSVGHSEFVEMNANGLNIVLNNINTYIAKIISHFGSLYYQLLIVSLFVTCYLFIIIYEKAKKIERLTVFGYVVPSVIVCLSPLLIFISSFLHLSLLAEPVFADRTLISFSGVMFFVGWICFLIVKRLNITIVFLLPIVFFFFIFSYSYGNALKAQKNYDSVLSANIVSDLNSHDLASSKDVVIYGVQPSSPVRNNSIRRYPLISSLVPLYMENNWYWGSILLYQYGMKNKRGVMPNTESLCKMTPLTKRVDYTMLSNESTIVVAFTRLNCN